MLRIAYTHTRGCFLLAFHLEAIKKKQCWREWTDSTGLRGTNDFELSKESSPTSAGLSITDIMRFEKKMMTTLFFVCSLLQISDQIVNTNAFFFLSLFFFLLQRTSERSVPIAVRFHRTLELGDDKYYVITCGRSAFRNSRSVSSFFLSQFGAKHIIVRFSFFVERRERETFPFDDVK